MKKRACLKSALLVTLVVALLFTMTACGSTKLNGTYRFQGVLPQSFTFDRDGNVTMSAFGIDATGTYVIEDDTITITYSLLGIDYDWEQSFKRLGSSIIINGTEFVKE